MFSRWWKMRELYSNIIENSLNTAMHVAVFFVRPPSGRADAADAERELQRTREDLIRLIGPARRSRCSRAPRAQASPSRHGVSMAADEA